MAKCPVLLEKKPGSGCARTNSGQARIGGADGAPKECCAPRKLDNYAVPSL
ncbi:hypothetical protein HDC32_004332 [Pseudomonas sp. JAI120]|nr:hypothetical protein [Pseudomonas sp. SJZ073]MBB6314619.1 hypothetical protein [Pseudomonas sp. JAI120]